MKPNPGNRDTGERERGAARRAFLAQAVEWVPANAPRTANAALLLLGLFRLFQSGSGRVYASYPEIAAVTGLSERQVQYGMPQLVAASPHVRRSGDRWTLPAPLPDGTRRRWRLRYFYELRLPAALRSLAAGMIRIKRTVTDLLAKSKRTDRGRDELTAEQLIEKRRAERGPP